MPGLSGAILQENKSQTQCKCWCGLKGVRNHLPVIWSLNTVQMTLPPPDLQFLSSEERTLFSWLKLLLLFTYAGKNQDTWCEVKDWQCCCGSLEMNFPVLALLGSAFPPTLFWSCLSLPPPSSCVLSLSILSKIFSSESPCTGNITEYWAFSSLGCSSTFCL